jgi:hypothetical protein
MTVYGVAARESRDENATTIDEDLMATVGESVCDSRLIDFEENPEELIVIAQSEWRNFLAYLLFMALMEAREEDRWRVTPPH